LHLTVLCCGGFCCCRTDSVSVLCFGKELGGPASSFATSNPLLGWLRSLVLGRIWARSGESIAGGTIARIRMEEWCRVQLYGLLETAYWKDCFRYAAGEGLTILLLCLRNPETESGANAKTNGRIGNGDEDGKSTY